MTNISDDQVLADLMGAADEDDQDFGDFDADLVDWEQVFADIALWADVEASDEAKAASQ
jgi:hypothetical protein